MAKEVFFSFAEPMSSATSERMFQFLIDATAKREQVTVTGTVREKSPASGKEAS